MSVGACGASAPLVPYRARRRLRRRTRQIPPSRLGLRHRGGLVVNAVRGGLPELPQYVGKALKSNPEAWSFFQTLPRRERRNFVVWIHIAKRPETRERRIRESLALLAAGRKLGLK